MKGRVRKDGFKFIKAIGTEIECGTDRDDQLRRIAEKYGAVKDYDGSVSVPAQYGCIELKRKWLVNRELRFLRGFAEEVFAVARQNHTCGNHFHVSLKNEATSIMASERFMRLFIKAYKKAYAGNEKYIGRLKNRYCKGIVSSQRIALQLGWREGQRYTAINAAAFPKHGTVEFRLMPHADNATEYMSQARFILKTVEAILAKLHKIHEEKLTLRGISMVGLGTEVEVLVNEKVQKEEVIECAS